MLKLLVLLYVPVAALTAEAPNCISPDDPSVLGSLEFDFFGSKVLYNNLGGMGPATSDPPMVRYANVARGEMELKTEAMAELLSAVPGASTVGQNVPVRFDLELANLTEYVVATISPGNPTSRFNGKYRGSFGSISLKAGHRVKLQMQLVFSCCLDDDCEQFLCSAVPDGHCTHAEYPRETHYDCSAKDVPVDQNELRLTLGLFDLDGSNDMTSYEKVTAYGLEGYDFVQPSTYPYDRVDENNVAVGISMQDGVGTFTAQEPGSGPDNPRNPKELLLQQAERSVNLKFVTQDGSINFDYEVSPAVTNERVSEAVETVLEDNDFAMGRLIFAVEAEAVGASVAGSQTYNLTVEALGTSMKELADYVNTPDFRTRLAAALGNGVEVSDPTNISFEVVPIPGSGALSDGSSLAETQEANVTVEDEVMSWLIILICLVLFCLVLIPMLIFYWVQTTYGKGNVTLWLRYKLAHHNPVWQLFYIPEDLHERLRMQLFEPKAFEAQLRKEMDEVDGVITGPNFTAV